MTDHDEPSFSVYYRVTGSFPKTFWAGRMREYRTAELIKNVLSAEPGVDYAWIVEENPG